MIRAFGLYPVAIRFLLVVAVLCVLNGVMARPSAASGPPKSSDDAEEVNQGPARQGKARHPLFIKVHGKDPRGNKLLTNSVPFGSSGSLHAKS